jgi:hypothetical protein
MEHALSAGLSRPKIEPSPSSSYERPIRSPFIQELLPSVADLIALHSASGEVEGYAMHPTILRLPEDLD